MIKKMARAILPTAVQARIRAHRALPDRIARLERQVALLAAHQARRAYGDAVGPDTGHSALNAHELQVYSQNGEDGIVQFIFSEIGVEHRTFVEFGMGEGHECNTAYLALHHGWRGLLMDGNAERAATARAFYTRMLGRGQDAVTVEEAWVTAENINGLLRQHGPAEIDLLSIDLDGIDYWVWKAIDAAQPRVVIVEYSAVLGWERAITVPNTPDFVRWEAHPGGLYAGASLLALEQLGRAKGYRLIGCNRHGVNAFFVRGDLATPALPAVPAAAAWYPCDDARLGLITPERFTEIAHMEFVDVGDQGA